MGKEEEEATMACEFTTGKTGKFKDPAQPLGPCWPHTIYFYYVAPGSTPGDPLQVYVISKPESDPIDTKAKLIEEIEMLTRNARSNAFPPAAFSFAQMPWWRRSYFVIALDEPIDKFDPEDAITISRDGTHPNHTFFNGWVEDLTIDGREVNVLACTNYMVKKNGKAIEAGNSHVFKLAFKIGLLPFIRDDDDSGTNMGPPVPPP